MTREDAVKLAVKCGGFVPAGSLAIKMYPNDLLVFAKMLTGMERESCAKVCEGLVDWPEEVTMYYAAECIRARGE